MAAWNGWTLSYDSFGRLHKATDGSVTHWHQYDEEGRRIGKKINGTQEWLLHGGYDLIESHEPVSGDTVSYIYEDGIDQPLAMITHGSPEVTTFFHQDVLGNVVMR